MRAFRSQPIPGKSASGRLFESNKTRNIRGRDTGAYAIDESQIEEICHLLDRMGVYSSGHRGPFSADTPGHTFSIDRAGAAVEHLAPGGEAALEIEDQIPRRESEIRRGYGKGQRGSGANIQEEEQRGGRHEILK